MIDDPISDKIRGIKRGITLLNFYSHGYKRHLAAVLLMSIVLGLLETFQIVLLYPIMNATIDFQGPQIAMFEPLYNAARNLVHLPDIVLFSLLFILLVSMTFVLSLVYRYTSIYVTKNVITTTKRKIFDRLVSNDYHFFVINKRGDIIYNVVTAPAEVRHFLNTSTNMLSESIIVITIIVTMFFISATAVIILLTGGILFILVVRYIGNKVAFRLGRLQMHSMRAENEVISGYLSGLRQIRSVCGDEHWRKKYDIALDEYWDRFIGLSFFRIIPSAILQFRVLVSIAVLVISLY
jgi:ABC-type multidrug transport system fused ATPase/permease subunit